MLFPKPACKLQIKPAGWAKELAVPISILGEEPQAGRGPIWVAHLRQVSLASEASGEVFLSRIPATCMASKGLVGIHAEWGDGFLGADE
jgi:hypothetical protein